MTLDEAIKIKEAYHYHCSKHMLSKERDADRMSIEALNRLQNSRFRRLADFIEPLPGETEE